MENVGHYGEYFLQHLDRWGTIQSEIYDHEMKGEWSAIEDKATKQIQQIDRARTTFGLQREQCVALGMAHVVETPAFFNWAQARMRGLNNLQGAVDDLTESLFLTSSRK